MWKDMVAWVARVGDQMNEGCEVSVLGGENMI